MPKCHAGGPALAIRLGQGSFPHRTGYAISRIFVTPNNPGHTQFKYSEIVANLAEAGVQTIYYPARDASVPNTVRNWSAQTKVDTLANGLKEFWPDICCKLFEK